MEDSVIFGEFTLMGIWDAPRASIVAVNTCLVQADACCLLLTTVFVSLQLEGLKGSYLTGSLSNLHV